MPLMTWRGGRAGAPIDDATLPLAMDARAAKLPVIEDPAPSGPPPSSSSAVAATKTVSPPACCDSRLSACEGEAA
jgi:hypothetical protein